MEAAQSISWQVICLVYAISVLGGIPLGWGLTKLLSLGVRNQAEKTAERVWWMIPLLLGIYERAICTTLVLLAPNVLPGFVAGWVLLKLAGGWGPLLKNPTLAVRSFYLISILGSTTSIAWAIGVSFVAWPSGLHQLAG